jgi:hypothetical protein
MAIPTFTLGYPPDGSSLGNTKTTIRNNLDGTFQALSVDHQDQNEVSAGSHTKVSLKNTSTTSTPTLPPGIFGAGFETLYSQAAGPLGLEAGELFMSRGGGAGIQLTGPGTPAKSLSNANSFLPGGLVIQCGLVSSTAATGIVIFPKEFATFPISITFGMIISSGSTTDHAGQVYVEAIPELTKTQFRWRQSSLSDDALGFFWTAIGF